MTLDEFIKTTHLEVEQWKEFYLKERKKGIKNKNATFPLDADKTYWCGVFIGWQQNRKS